MSDISTPRRPDAEPENEEIGDNLATDPWSSVPGREDEYAARGTPQQDDWSFDDGRSGSTWRS